MSWTICHTTIVNMNTNNVWSVYKHTSPSGKVYIGVAKDINHRWRSNGEGYRGSTRIHNAIKKYGWDNFKHEILFSGLSQSEACRKEAELITTYNSTNEKYGYNLQSGGQYFETNRATREKISKSLIGHTVSDEARDKIRNSRSIQIICLETGDIYNGCIDASNQLGLCSTSIGKVVNGKQQCCGGLHFAKLQDYLNNSTPIFQPHPAQYKVVQCVSTGEIFKNISEASKSTGVSRRAISYACNGKHKTSGGMLWEFVTNDNLQS